MPDGPLATTVGQAVPFEAVAYTPDGANVVSHPKWSWRFDDGAKSSKNPTDHAYSTAGTYTVTVTATAREGVGSAETMVVVNDETMLESVTTARIYVCQNGSSATWPYEEDVCDNMSVIVLVPQIGMVTAPSIWRQNAADFGTGNWTQVAPTSNAVSVVVEGTSCWRNEYFWQTYDLNWPVRFEGRYSQMIFTPPFYFQFVHHVVGPKEWCPGDTIVKSPDEVLLYDGDPVTIPWEIFHLDYGPPTFKVTVQIFDIGAPVEQPLKTIVLAGQTLGSGSTTWDGETDLGMPPGSQVAEPGVYKYRIVATHELPHQLCSDYDTANFLHPEVVEFRYWLLPTADPAEATMAGYIKYGLNRDAGSARCAVYGADTSGAYPTLMQADIECPTLTQGEHLAEAFSFTVPVDANGDLDGTYYAVIFAVESPSDGAIHRDSLAKDALEHGITPTLMHLNLSVAGRDEETEEDPGGYLCVNLGDDDTDSNEDRTQTTPAGGIASEDDLIALTLALPTPSADVGTLTLSASAGGAKIGDCVWLAANKAPVGAVHSWALGSAATTWDLSQSEAPSQFGVWLEGVARSGACRDITLELSFTAAGAEPLVDRVKLTVFEVTQLTPSGGDPVRVMVSTLHDDTYHTPNQTEDGKVRIEATLSPVEEGVPVCFRGWDPDDLSPYEADAEGDDNYSFDPLGSLSAHDGYTAVPGSGIGEPLGVWRLAVYSDANGMACADLGVAPWPAGDNFEVHTNPCTGPDAGDGKTDTLVAWKRVYVEEDFMYREGTDLAADFTADADANPDQLMIADSWYVGVGDFVVVFDADHPLGEEREVLAKAGATVTVADLANDYDAGYPRATGRGASIVKASAAASGDVFDGRFTSAAGDTPSALVLAAYGVETDGTDGGCFVEFVPLQAGSGRVPYREGFGSSSARSDYTDVWFQNRGGPNYIHALGACYDASFIDHVYGVASSAENRAYVYVQMLTDDFPGAASSACMETGAHEFGHLFDIAPADDAHPDVWAHDGSDKCLMCYLRMRDDGIAEFCVDLPGEGDDVDGCIYDVRHRTDGI